MKTKLIALNAELELIKEEYSVIYDKLISDLDKIINKYFIEPFDAKCIRRWFREDFHLNRGVYINFEIGFYNAEENRVDFGSDIWFEYCTAEGQLKVNYGTCGSYSKADIYQVKRVKTPDFSSIDLRTISKTKKVTTAKPVVKSKFFAASLFGAFETFVSIYPNPFS